MPPSNLKLNKDIKLPGNRLWFERYEESPQEKQKYLSTLRIFLRYSDFEDISLSSFSVDEMKLFLNKIEEIYGDSRKNTYRLAILNFWEFLLKNSSDRFMGLDIVDYLDRMGDEIKHNKSVKTPLKLMEIMKIRQELADNPEYLYYFEMLYQTGCGEKKDFLPSHNSKATIKTRVRELLGESKLLSLLDKLDFDQFTWYRKKTDVFLNEVERILRQNDMWKSNKKISIPVLNQTHDAYFIPCPNCGRRVENLAENWVLVREVSDKQFYVVCKYCKGICGENH